MPDDTKLTVKIENVRPVELIDLTRSLMSIAEEYSRYLPHSDHPLGFHPGVVKLYVKEIRTGSFIADLVTLAPFALAFMENSNTLIGFSEYMKTAFDYLKGKGKEKPPFSRIDYENITNIVEPIAKDNGSNFIFQTINNNVTNIYNINSPEANAIQSSARREINLLQEPTSSTKERVVFYWHQAKGDAKSQTGDKGKIESVHDSAVKTIFQNEQIKKKMVLDEENPFKFAYVVDVAVETINGKPVLYNVLGLHEKFDKPEGN